MSVVRQAPGRVLLVIVVAAVAVAVGARLAFARSVTTPIGTGIVVIDTNLAYVNGAAAGTGMVLTSSGEVLTSNHVIAGATTIKVVVPNTGRSYTARVVGYSRSSDVALLQLQHASNLKTVSTSASATLTVGAAVKAVGNAGGSGSLISATGTVTGLGRTITASDDQGGSEQLTGLIETDAGVEPGDSGGPLLNSSGKVIGMVTAASTSSGFQSVAASDAYAIPIGKALAMARQIEAGKATATVHVGETAFLGISVGPVGAGRYGYGYGDSPTPMSGALIAAVVAGGPADSAGLGAGDVITRLGGRTVSSPTAVTAFVMAKKPGQKVSVRYVDQSGVGHTTSVTLGSGPPQ
jgi:S1-C subfamily serine protease